MNIFGAITVGVFVITSVISARLADKFLPDFQVVPRGGVILLVSVIFGFAITRLYLHLLDRQADAHALTKGSDSDTRPASQIDKETKSDKTPPPPTTKQ